MRVRPELLLALPLYAFALAAPLSVSVGTLAVAAIGAAALFRQLHPRTRRFDVPVSLIAVVLVFASVHALATAMASPFPVRWGKWQGEMFLKLLLVAVPLAAADRPNDVVRAVKLLIATGSLVAIYGAYQHFTGHDLWRGGSTYNTGHGYFAVGFFGHHLTYGGQVMLMLLAAAAWLLRVAGVGRAGRAIWAPAMCTALLGSALLWSHARSAQIGAAVGGLMLAALLPGRTRWATLGGLVVLGTAAALMPGVGARFLSVGDAARDSTRLMLWESSLRGVAHRPWLGFGCGNFDDLMRQYGIPAQYETISHAHNDLLMHAVNAGGLGLAAAIGLLVVSVWLLWRARAVAGPAAWVVLAALACEGAITAGGLFQVFQTDNEVEMVLYFIIGCGIALGRPPRPSRTSAPAVPA